MTDIIDAIGLLVPLGNTNNQERLVYRAELAADAPKIANQYRGILRGASSSNGTLIFRVRVGQLGTTADPEAWRSITSAAQVANQRAGFDFLATVRQVGTAGLIQVEGLGFAHAALLPTVVSAVSTVPIDTTKKNWLSMTVVCSSGIFTAHQGLIREI